MDRQAVNESFFCDSLGFGNTWRVRISLLIGLPGRGKRVAPEKRDGKDGNDQHAVHDSSIVSFHGCFLNEFLVLFHQLDFTWPPFLCEEGLERAVEAHARNKTFTWHGLDPVASFDARWLRRAEVDRGRAVGIRFGRG